MMITHGEITFKRIEVILLPVPLSATPVFKAAAPINRIKNISIILFAVINAKSMFPHLCPATGYTPSFHTLISPVIIARLISMDIELMIPARSMSPFKRSVLITPIDEIGAKAMITNILFISIENGSRL
jgi:hypothetical protein